jgi:biopolymer transport protein ExbD
MAEINSEMGGRNKQRNRKAKVSTKIDMTPMVDLAFLLITFFMLTTTFSKPSTMEVNMPDRGDATATMPVSEKRVITFILGKENAVYWYRGDNKPEHIVFEKIDFSQTERVRKVLLEQTKLIKDTTNQEAVVLIKSLDQAKYGSLVNLLDELHITNQKIYAIVDVYEVEKEVLTKQFGSII